MKKYDLIVIGSGPGGEKAAVKAAYFGHKVAVIEKEPVFGGAGVNTGTLPSKTLKETSIYLSGRGQKGLYSVTRELTHEATAKDFLFRKDLVLEYAETAVAENFKRHGVDVYEGLASFEDEHHVHISGTKEEVLYGESIIIATGSYPVHPEGVPFDHDRVHDSDSVLGITRFPHSICIVGAGVIGCEYATIFATMGTKVYLINRTDNILGFADQEIVAHLKNQMAEEGIEMLFDTAIDNIDAPHEADKPLNVHLHTGEVLHVDMYLFAAGRNGCVSGLNLEKIGVKVGKREQIEVNERYQTAVPNVYAVGDVIGFPALAATSMDQGRVAVANIFRTNDLEFVNPVLPFGIYTIPEVSLVGISEEQAQAKGLDYVVGRAYDKDTHRGKIMGAKAGFLKVIFTRDDLVIHGVHAFGPFATELIHYGMLLVQDKKTIHQVVASVFNTPTLHELYKYACYDGLSNLTGKTLKA